MYKTGNILTSEISICSCLLNKCPIHWCRCNTVEFLKINETKTKINLNYLVHMTLDFFVCRLSLVVSYVVTMYFLSFARYNYLCIVHVSFISLCRSFGENQIRKNLCVEFDTKKKKIVANETWQFGRWEQYKSKVASSQAASFAKRCALYVADLRNVYAHKQTH